MQVDLLHPCLGAFRISRFPCPQILVERQGEKRRVRHSRAREPKVEVDVDDVRRQHPHIRLLLCAELEIVQADQHREDVKA